MKLPVKMTTCNKSVAFLSVYCMPFCCQVQSACVNFNFCDFDKDLIVNVDLANSNFFGLKFFRGPTTHHRRKNEQLDQCCQQLVAMLCQPRTQALHCSYRDQRQIIIQARKGARSTRNEGSYNFQSRVDLAPLRA